MKKGTKLFFGTCLAIGLAIVFTGCASAPQIEKKQEPAKLMIGNHLTIPIVHVYMSPAGKNNWEDILIEPLLPNSLIVGEKGKFKNTSYLPIAYDFRMEDSEGNTYTFLDEDMADDDSYLVYSVSIIAKPEFKDE